MPGARPSLPRSGSIRCLFLLRWRGRAPAAPGRGVAQRRCRTHFACWGWARRQVPRLERRVGYRCPVHGNAVGCGRLVSAVARRGQARNFPAPRSLTANGRGGDFASAHTRCTHLFVADGNKFRAGGGVQGADQGGAQGRALRGPLPSSIGPDRLPGPCERGEREPRRALRPALRRRPGGPSDRQPSRHTSARATPFPAHAAGPPRRTASSGGASTARGPGRSSARRASTRSAPSAARPARGARACGVGHR